MKIVKLTDLPKHLGVCNNKNGSLSFGTCDSHWVSLRDLKIVVDYIEFVSNEKNTLLVLRGPTIVSSKTTPSLIWDNYASVMVLGIILKHAIEKENASFEISFTVKDNLTATLTLNEASSILNPTIMNVEQNLILLKKEELIFDQLVRYRVNQVPLFLEPIRF